MAFHGRCIVPDTPTLFLRAHQFSFTCHGAGSMEKGKEGEKGGEEGQTQPHCSSRALQGRAAVSECLPAEMDSVGMEKGLGVARAAGEASVRGVISILGEKPENVAARSAGLWQRRASLLSADL